jgi:hypothetical protein
MGMSDYYVPARPLSCPVDGNLLTDWQGKQGPCFLLRWREGVAMPDYEGVGVDEEWHMPVERREKIRLPPTFAIYSFDCEAHEPIIADCTTVDGVWVSTTIREPGGTHARNWAVASSTISRATERSRSPKPREFILIDLATQMPYLPRSAKEWPRERMLAWLRVWGEVEVMEPRTGVYDKDRYTFRSWAGRWTWFVLTEDGDLFIPGLNIQAWPEPEQ